MNDTESPRPAPNAWTAQIATWAVIVVGHIGLVTLTSGFEWAGAIVYLEAGLIGLLISHRLHRVALVRDWYGHRLGPWLLRALPASVLAGSTLILALRVLNDLTSPLLVRSIGGYEELRSFHDRGQVAGLIVYWSGIFLIWFFVRYGTEVRDRLRSSEVKMLQLEHAVTEERLRALRAQLDPHFVFNSLNGIRALITEDAERAREMVTRLSDILRYTLRTADSTVPLGDEIATVRSYLALQSVRFEDRLGSTLRIQDAAAAAPVPPMIVQHLVENAVKHGLEQTAGPLHIDVTASVDDDQVEVEVSHEGRIRASARAGGGLEKSAERLRLLHAAHAQIELTEKSGRVVARLRFPFQTP